MTVPPTSALTAGRASNSRPPVSRPGRLAGFAAGATALLAAAVVIAGCASSAAGASGAASSQSGSASSAGGQVTDTAGGAAPSNGSGSGSGSRSGSGDGSGNGRNGGAAGRAAGAANRPGASGTIAAVQSQSFEVQNSSSQTTVTFTKKTDISKTVKGTLSDITVGSCVTAIAAADRSSSSGEVSAAPAAPTTQVSGQRFPGRTTPSTITASTVSIEQPAADGSCTNTLFGGGRGNLPNGGGAFPSGFPSGRALPSRMPNGGALPSGAPEHPTQGGGANRGNGNGPGGFGGFGGIVSGQVSKVSGSKIEVTVTEFAGIPGRAAGTTEATRTTTTPTTTTTTSTVTVTDSTTYSKTVTAKPSAITVGLCASAFGTADDTGAIAATEIRLSTATKGECSSGFGAGGFGGFRGRGGSGGQGNAPVTSNG